MINKIKAEILFSKGDKQAKSGLLDESITSFNRAISFSPFYSGIYLHKALCLSKKKEYSEAIQTLNKAIEMKPNNSAFRLFIGIIYYDSKNYDEALNAFNKTLVLSSDNLLALSYKNLVLLIKGENTDEASEIIKNNIKNTNSDFQIRLLEFCETYCLQNKGTDKPVDILYDLYNVGIEGQSSVNYFNSFTLKLSTFCYSLLYWGDPIKKSAHIHYNNAARAQLSGQIDTAIEEYNKALKIDNQFNDAEDKLIELYWNKNDYYYFLKSFKHLPVYNEILSLINKLKASNKESGGAERGRTDKLHLIFMLAYAYFQTNEYDSAFEIFTLLSKHNQQNPLIFYYLALCYLLKDNPDEARISFQKSIEKLDHKIIDIRYDKMVELLIENVNSKHE